MASRDVRLNGSTLQASHPAVEPTTPAEREMVRNQLNLILASSMFHNSKRYASVLKFIVEETLEGAGAQLKERTIGIEVFHRPPDYDTTDHVVRSAVGEVRKRLAQYYQENLPGPVRIEVLPGSYIPLFRWAEESPALTSGPDKADPSSEPPPPGPVAVPAGAPKAGISKWFRPKRVAALGVAILACLAALLVALQTPNLFDSFWRPILSSRAPVLLCVGNLAGGRGSEGGNQGLSPTLTLKEFHSSESETVHVYDAMTLARFAGLMQASGKQYQLASQSDATFTDLQKGPAILVGLMNNNWTERLVPQLRFTVEHPSPSRITIRDRNHPSNTEWSIDYSTPYLDVAKDYALVLRMVDPKTDQIVVVAAGITVFGTFAAGEFLTDKNEMKKLAAFAPRGWDSKNMELVLSTDVIRGHSGPATIVAAQFW
jgi:hypothetical protein